MSTMTLADLTARHLGCVITLRMGGPSGDRTGILRRVAHDMRNAPAPTLGTELIIETEPARAEELHLLSSVECTVETLDEWAARFCNQVALPL